MDMSDEAMEEAHETYAKQIEVALEELDDDG